MLSSAYKVLINTFTFNQVRRLKVDLASMGPTISKSEGQRLGLNQDAYNRFRSGQRS